MKKKNNKNGLLGISGKELKKILKNISKLHPDFKDSELNKPKLMGGLKSCICNGTKKVEVIGGKPGACPVCSPKF